MPVVRWTVIVTVSAVSGTVFASFRSSSLNHGWLWATVAVAVTVPPVGVGVGVGVGVDVGVGVGVGVDVGVGEAEPVGVGVGPPNLAMLFLKPMPKLLATPL